ncbi:MAG: hypothetical protein Hens3KO_12100 [Henriciella sp.]
MTFDTQTFRDTLGLFVTGVTIITTRTSNGEPIGITANSFNSVSLNPPLVLWSIANSSRSIKDFKAAKHYAVHILRDDQMGLSNRFAMSGADKFKDIKIHNGLGDTPVLPDCAACLECSVYGHHIAGDHIIFVAQVESLQSDSTAQPLVYHGGRYANLSDQSQN